MVVKLQIPRNSMQKGQSGMDVCATAHVILDMPVCDMDLHGVERQECGRGYSTVCTYIQSLVPYYMCVHYIC